MIGAFERAFLTAGVADAEEVDAVLLEVFFPALSVGPERVAAVDDDVAGLQERDELLDHGVHRRAGFDHDLRLAGTLERGDEILERLCEDEILALPTACLECLHDAGRAVIDGDVEALAFHVQDEVFAHHGEADQADVTGAHKVFEVGFYYLEFERGGRLPAMCGRWQM